MNRLLKCAVLCGMFQSLVWSAAPLRAADDAKTDSDKPAAKAPAAKKGEGKAAGAKKGPPAITAKKELDVTYATVDGTDLKLDLYFPNEKPAQPAPMAVYIHGGGWQKGTKTGGGYLQEITNELTSRGFVVASIEYRLYPSVQWPTYIYDVKAGIRFLRANASKYGADPDRIGVWGGSAGGHLVSLLGTTDANDKLEGDEGNNDKSSRVQCVVDLFGPSDFSLFPQDKEKVLKQFGSLDNYKPASPVTYVTKDDPPFLILQGDADVLVPQVHSERLHEKLTAAGVDSTLVIVKKGTHGLNGTDITPSRDSLITMICDFFDKHLGKSAKQANAK